MLHTCVALLWPAFEPSVCGLQLKAHYDPKYRKQESTMETSDLPKSLGQSQEQNFYGQSPKFYLLLRLHYWTSCISCLVDQRQSAHT